MGSPIDGQTKDEIVALIKSVAGIFTTHYVKNYSLQLVKKAIKESKEQPEPWRLLEREAPKDDIKSGYLVKEGAIRKNWKKRWFVVHYDYNTDYFTDEKAAKKEKPKPKGTMSLGGYHVVENIGESLLQQTKELAEKMNIDVSELPKPKTYPEHSFEIHHPRRRCWFIQASNADEKKQWMEMFKSCCRNSWGLKDHDPVHVKAFKYQKICYILYYSSKAVRDTRWSLGRWGWWSWGGSEEQVLTDIISDEIDWQIMGKIYAKITGPWMVRSTIRNQVLKIVDTLVSAGVGPAWRTMSATVQEIRPKLEPKIKESIEPVAGAKQNLHEKMREAAMSVITPLLEKHVTPHLGKIVEILTSPVTDAYAECFKIFEEGVNKYAENSDLKALSKGFGDLDWLGRSYWTLRHATEKLDVLYEPLHLLREVFPDINPWNLIWNGHDQLRKRMDNAVYTFEERLKKKVEENPEAGKEVIEEVKNSVLEDFKHDGAIHKVQFYTEIIKAIVMPPFTQVVFPAVKELLEPLKTAIPDPLQDLVDVSEEFETLVNGIVDSSIETILVKS